MKLFTTIFIAAFAVGILLAILHRPQLTILDVAELTGIKATEIVKRFFMKGQMITVKDVLTREQLLFIEKEFAVVR